MDRQTSWARPFLQGVKTSVKVQSRNDQRFGLRHQTVEEAREHVYHGINFKSDAIIMD